jgi:hypothetical protein
VLELRVVDKAAQEGAMGRSDRDQRLAAAAAAAPAAALSRASMARCVLLRVPGAAPLCLPCSSQSHDARRRRRGRWRQAEHWWGGALAASGLVAFGRAARPRPLGPAR